MQKGLARNLRKENVFTKTGTKTEFKNERKEGKEDEERERERTEHLCCYDENNQTHNPLLISAWSISLFFLTNLNEPLHSFLSSFYPLLLLSECLFILSDY